MKVFDENDTVSPKQLFPSGAGQKCQEMQGFIRVLGQMWIFRRASRAGSEMPRNARFYKVLRQIGGFFPWNGWESPFSSKTFEASGEAQNLSKSVYKDFCKSFSKFLGPKAF